jgi:hypothetical protein
MRRPIPTLVKAGSAVGRRLLVAQLFFGRIRRADDGRLRKSRRVFSDGGALVISGKAIRYSAREETGG